MYRKLIYLISFVLVLGLAGYAAAAPGDMNNPILIPATGQAPVIDGVREALWSGSDKHSITRVTNGATPTDTNDLSSSWWALWDSQYFYVFMDVNDESLKNDSAQAWLDDSVEVMIDIGNNDRTSYNGFEADDYQYRFSWGSTNPTQGEEFYHGTRSMPGVQWFVKKHTGDPNGYAVEIKIPWTSTYYPPSQAPPELGELMGLDFHVNDDDDPGTFRDTQTGWYGPEATWNNPSLMGTVKFVGARTATNPNPVNDAEGVLDTIVQWMAGSAAETHDVYFGDTNNPLPFIQNQSGTTYDPPGVLNPGIKYYWKVDEVNSPTTWPGYEWCFTTASTTAYDPDPYDGNPLVFVDANLSWGPGFYATTHNVYLSTNPALPPPAVSTGQTTTTYNPPSNLNGETKYYWRVDEVGPPDYTGPVWSFTTANALIGLTGEYFDNADLLGNPVLVRIDYNIDFDWGQDPPGPLLPADNFSVRWTAEVNVPSAGTYTFFVVRSVRPASDSVRLWVNGELLIDDWPGDDAIVEDSGIIFLSAGPALLVMEYQDTATTAVAQLSWQCLPSLPREVIPVGRFTRLLPLMARFPSPFDGDKEARSAPTLTWTPGLYAAVTDGHELYFSSDFNDVNERKIAAGPHILSNPIYTPGLLPRPQTYYWRVDEVNDACSPYIWPGNIWSFAVSIYEVVDNFEPYIATGTRDLSNRYDPIVPAGSLRRTWIDGLWTVQREDIFDIPTDGTSGSYVQLNTDPCDDATNKSNIAQGGTKSMKLYYDNGGTIKWISDLRLLTIPPGVLWDYGPAWNYSAPKYSEASAAVDNTNDPNFDPDNQNSLGMSRNWSGYKLLKLSYYGDPNNSLTIVATDKLYVTLEDGSHRVATVTNPDQTYIQRFGWHDWYISLSIGSGSFKAQNASLDLTDIARIYIGIGRKASPPATGGKGAVFFDDIRLYPVSVCIQGTVAGDFSGDCEVDANDLQRMKQIWLAQPTQTPVINLDASGLLEGTLSTWTNTGSAGGNFVDFNMPKQPGLRPKVQMVGGVKAVVFDGNDIMKANIKAPASITGSGPHTVIYKVWNLDIGLAERVFTWAKRSTGTGLYGRFADVGYGNSTAYGAVGHGAAGPNDPDYDMGFDGGIPAAVTWHTIGVTYPGGPNGVQTVMVDGVVNATKAMTLNIWPDCNMTVGGGYDGNSTAVPPDPNRVITPNAALFFSGALAKLQVYSVAIPPNDLVVLMGTPIDMKQDYVINFKDLALFAAHWRDILLFP